ncbi:MAG: hypothetical protein QM220_00650 [Atribacterota bacterium]|nr:hypothetical protein [Atribacterota bacterium]
MIVENNEFRCGSSGVYMVWFKYGVDSNIISNNTFDGVGVGSDDSYAIADSLFNPQHGGKRETIIEDNTIKNTYGVGIYACYGNYDEKDWGTVTIEGNTIENNTVGIRVGDKTDKPNYGIDGIIAHGNTIKNNGIGVENIKQDTTFDAIHNWWGNPSGPKHDTLNPSGRGDAVSDNVDFKPWCTNRRCTFFWN